VFSLYPQKAYKRIKEKNITIFHGDIHFWSFLYPKEIENENSNVKLLYWENWGIGVGCQDLASLISLFWPSERRYRMEKYLVKRYHNGLSNFGVKNYNWDECWHDYRFSILFNLYIVVYWWNIGYHNINWHALETIFLAIEDLNCMELLEMKKSGEGEK
jgi:hypothetical protein